MSLSLSKRSNYQTYLFVFVACSLVGAVGTAQTRYVDGPWGGGGGYRHASTAAEGAQRGFADVVRSAGEYNLNTAQAASIGQDTVSKYLDNRMKGTSTYFQMRQANDQYRRAEKTPPLSSEQLYRIAAEKAPKELSSSDVDPLTGQIAWPPVLQGDAFADTRTKLEALFVQRAKGGSSDYVFQAQQVAKEALTLLKANIRNYPASEYLQAKRFLERLAFTARAPHL